MVLMDLGLMLSIIIKIMKKTNNLIWVLSFTGEIRECCSMGRKMQQQLKKHICFNWEKNHMSSTSYSHHTRMTSTLSYGRGCAGWSKHHYNIPFAVRVKTILMCDRKAADLVFDNGGLSVICVRKQKLHSRMLIIKAGFTINKTEIYTTFTTILKEMERRRKLMTVKHARGNVTNQFLTMRQNRSKFSMDYYVHLFILWVFQLGVQVLHGKRLNEATITERLQHTIEEDTGIQPDPLGKSDTSTTGNIAKRLLHNEREVIITVLSKKHKPLFRSWGNFFQ